MNLKETKSLLKRLNIQPKKSLGQNFLINTKKIDQIMHLFNEKDFDSILEIGPGLGALTEKIKNKKKLYLVELDKKISHYWKSKNYQVFQKDILKFNWQKIKSFKKVLLLGNLSYQISSRLIVDLSLKNLPISLAIFMFQKEVYEKLIAQKNSKSYCLLSAVSQSFWEIKKIQHFYSKDFFPVPKVSSTLVSLEIKNKEFKEKEEFLKFLKKAFSQRRKYLINNLIKDFKREKCLKTFDHLKISSKIRVGDLSPKELKELFVKLNEKLD